MNLQDTVKKLFIDRIERHIFLCADQSKPKCCDKELGIACWEYLKKRLQELGLDQPSQLNANCVFRTKANCLRVCLDGPILLVYPDGVWYRQATPEVIEQILQQHILGNQIVEEYAFYIHPLDNIVKFD
jgi:(2Fe-2S) ferredoxin